MLCGPQSLVFATDHEPRIEWISFQQLPFSEKWIKQEILISLGRAFCLLDVSR